MMTLPKKIDNTEEENFGEGEIKSMRNHFSERCHIMICPVTSAGDR